MCSNRWITLSTGSNYGCFLDSAIQHLITEGKDNNLWSAYLYHHDQWDKMNQYYLVLFYGTVNTINLSSITRFYFQLKNTWTLWQVCLWIKTWAIYRIYHALPFEDIAWLVCVHNFSVWIVVCSMSYSILSK